MKKLSLLPVFILAIFLYACGPSGEDHEKIEQEADSIAKEMLKEIEESLEEPVEVEEDFDHDYEGEEDHDHDHDHDESHDHDGDEY